MKTIFIAPYRNVSIRYMLSTNIFGVLKRKKDLRIIIILKKEHIDYYKKKYGGSNLNIYFEDILYEEAFNQFRSRTGSFFNLLRIYFYGKKGEYKNNAPEIWGYQYDQEFSKSKIKGKIYLSLVKLITFFCNKGSYFRRFIVYLESRLLNGSMYDQYFSDYDPTLLITSSTGYMIDPLIMRAAKRNNCKVISLVHSWDNPTTKAYRGAEPDYVITWNEIMKDELNIFQDIKKEKIYIGGIAHWDVYFNGAMENGNTEKFIENINFSKNRKTILYATSAPNTFKTTFDIIEEILNNIQNNKIRTPSQLLVRLHPNYMVKQKNKDSHIIDLFTGRIEMIKSKYGDSVLFNLPKVKWLNDDYELPIEDVKNLGYILQNTDLLLTEYSTLMIEGSIFDVPIINIGMGKFKDTDEPISVIENLNHIIRVLKTGATKQAYKMSELIELINIYLENPHFDRENRKKLVEQEITTNIGHAGESIGKYIYSLIVD